MIFSAKSQTLHQPQPPSSLPQSQQQQQKQPFLSNQQNLSNAAHPMTANISANPISNLTRRRSSSFMKTVQSNQQNNSNAESNNNHDEDECSPKVRRRLSDVSWKKTHMKENEPVNIIAKNQIKPCDCSFSCKRAQFNPRSEGHD